MSQRDSTKNKEVGLKEIKTLLEKNGYNCTQNANVGQRLGGSQHKIDILAEKGALCYLISLKWQEVSGTAEQKVPFEVICLSKTINSSDGKYEKAYLILGGKKWTLRDFYVGGELKKYCNCEKVEILTLDDFLTLTNL